MIDFKTSTTLVTGATGLVGNNVVRMLLERGASVKVLVRQGSDPRPLKNLDVEIVCGDTRNVAAVREAAKGTNLVVHSAAIVRIGRRKMNEFRAINVDGTRNVAAAAREAGARMVHVSSTDAVGTKSLDEAADEDTPFDASIKTPYIRTKHEAEHVVLDEVARGLDAVIVNPSFMLGPWDWKPSSGEMLLAVARGTSWMAPRGYFSVVDVRDVCQGILSAADRGETGRRYILAGKTMSYLEAWRLFAKVTGGRRPWCRTGPIIALVTGWVGDIIGLVRGDEPGFNSGAIKVANMPRNYSSARARKELGYKTRPVSETVEDAWQWFIEYGYARPKPIRQREPAPVRESLARDHRASTG